MRYINLLLTLTLTLTLTYAVEKLLTHSLWPVTSPTDRFQNSLTVTVVAAL